MQQKFVTFLKAVQLFQTELISSVVCASYCTAVAECYYMTVDTENIVCTFYSQGSTYYNTTDLTTYVLVSTWVEVGFISTLTSFGGDRFIYNYNKNKLGLQSDCIIINLADCKPTCYTRNKQLFTCRT